MNSLGYVIGIAAGFLMGGIMFSQILPQMINGTDIQAISDDHNPGATNVFVNCGPGMGFLCLFLDIAKGLVPVFLACKFLNTENLLFGLLMAAPVLGHAIAPFHHFHGGKCIATAFGVMLGLLPFHRVGLLLAAIYVLFSTVVKIQPNRIRSIITFALFGILSAIWLTYTGRYAIALGCILISLTAIIKHSKYFCNC